MPHSSKSRYQTCHRPKIFKCLEYLWNRLHWYDCWSFGTYINQPISVSDTYRYKYVSSAGYLDAPFTLNIEAQRGSGEEDEGTGCQAWADWVPGMFLRHLVVIFTELLSNRLPLRRKWYYSSNCSEPTIVLCLRDGKRLHRETSFSMPRDILAASICVLSK